MRLISRKKFESIIGDAYGEDNEFCGYISARKRRTAHFDERSEQYKKLVDMFQDDDLWISEWLYCQRRCIPFEYSEEDEHGYETITRITSGEEFYKFLVMLMKEKEKGMCKYRYRV